jgi:hypothetical protein
MRKVISICRPSPPPTMKMKRKGRRSSKSKRGSYKRFRRNSVNWKSRKKDSYSKNSNSSAGWRKS